jgi:cell division protein ZapE
VADAMLLSTLLQALLSHSVVLVATSNTAPDDLYLGGVQRQRFLPVIAQIKEHCQVIALKETHDYRLGRAPLSTSYVYPLDAAATDLLERYFSDIAGNTLDASELWVQRRQIACVRLGARAVWFRFDDICNRPRSQLDYLEISDRFDTVFVSDIPILSSDDTTRVVLLMHLIDVMYDKNVQLVISAADTVDKLYVQGPLRQVFQRTLSRLQEMQSEDYARRHPRRV